MAVTSDDVQRLFLQAVLSRRILSLDLAKLLWRKSIDVVNAANEELNIRHSEDQESWEEFVKNVNESVNNLDFEFRHIQDEITGRSMYALVNRRGDDVAQLATEYSPAEITYFKGIVEQIMLAPHESFSVSSLLALRELSALKLSMTKSQAETLLASFVAKGWLLKSKRGRYSLSPRALLELQPYLKATYPDEIVECTICMDMMTCGIKCYTKQCKARMHNHCFKTYIRRQKACPACQANWSGDENQSKLRFVGEGAVKDGQDEQRRTRQVDDDDVDGEEEGTQSAPSQSQQTRSQPARSQRKGKQREVESDEDEEEEESDGTPEPVQTQMPKRSRRDK